jgi:hypothetical protein
VSAAQWRTDAPPLNVLVVVWWWGEGNVVAAWDGTHWRDEQRRKLRPPVTHWHER